MALEAQQGHPYLFCGQKVIALETGQRVKVLFVIDGIPWFGKVMLVQATYLTPQPLRYLHGQFPKI